MVEIVLCNLSDANKTIEEIRSEWVLETLMGLDVPEDAFDLEYSDYCTVLDEMGIEVQKSTGGTINIYKLSWHEEEHYQGWLPPTKHNLVAQWKSPKRVKRIEGKEVYYELHLDCWSVTK